MPLASHNNTPFQQSPVSSQQSSRQNGSSVEKDSMLAELKGLHRDLQALRKMDRVLYAQRRGDGVGQANLMPESRSAPLLDGKSVKSDRRSSVGGGGALQKQSREEFHVDLLPQSSTVTESRFRRSTDDSSSSRASDATTTASSSQYPNSSTHNNAMAAPAPQASIPKSAPTEDRSQQSQQQHQNQQQNAATGLQEDSPTTFASTRSVDSASSFEPTPTPTRKDDQHLSRGGGVGNCFVPHSGGVVEDGEPTTNASTLMGTPKSCSTAASSSQSPKTYDATPQSRQPQNDIFEFQLNQQSTTNQQSQHHYTNDGHSGGGKPGTTTTDTRNGKKNEYVYAGNPQQPGQHSGWGNETPRTETSVAQSSAPSVSSYGSSAITGQQQASGSYHYTAQARNVGRAASHGSSRRGGGRNAPPTPSTALSGCSCSSRSSTSSYSSASSVTGTSTSGSSYYSYRPVGETKEFEADETHKAQQSNSSQQQQHEGAQQPMTMQKSEDDQTFVTRNDSIQSQNSDDGGREIDHNGNGEAQHVGPSKDEELHINFLPPEGGSRLVMREPERAGADTTVVERQQLAELERQFKERTQQEQSKKGDNAATNNPQGRNTQPTTTEDGKGTPPTPDADKTNVQPNQGKAPQQPQDPAAAKKQEKEEHKKEKKEAKRIEKEAKKQKKKEKHDKHDRKHHTPSTHTQQPQAEAARGNPQAPTPQPAATEQSLNQQHDAVGLKVEEAQASSDKPGVVTVTKGNGTGNRNNLQVEELPPRPDTPACSNMKPHKYEESKSPRVKGEVKIPNGSFQMDHVVHTDDGENAGKKYSRADENISAEEAEQMMMEQRVRQSMYNKKDSKENAFTSLGSIDRRVPDNERPLVLKGGHGHGMLKSQQQQELTVLMGDVPVGGEHGYRNPVVSQVVLPEHVLPEDNPFGDYANADAVDDDEVVIPEADRKPGELPHPPKQHHQQEGTRHGRGASSSSDFDRREIGTSPMTRHRRHSSREWHRRQSSRGGQNIQQKTPVVAVEGHEVSNGAGKRGEAIPSADFCAADRPQSPSSAEDSESSTSCSTCSTCSRSSSGEDYMPLEHEEESATPSVSGASSSSPRSREVTSAYRNPLDTGLRLGVTEQNRFGTVDRRHMAPGQPVTVKGYQTGGLPKAQEEQELGCLLCGATPPGGDEWRNPVVHKLEIPDEPLPEVKITPEEWKKIRHADENEEYPWQAPPLPFLRGSVGIGGAMPKRKDSGINPKQYRRGMPKAQEEQERKMLLGGVPHPAGIMNPVIHRIDDEELRQGCWVKRQHPTSPVSFVKRYLEKMSKSEAGAMGKIEPPTRQVRSVQLQNCTAQQLNARVIHKATDGTVETTKFKLNPCTGQYIAARAVVGSKEPMWIDLISLHVPHSQAREREGREQRKKEKEEKRESNAKESAAGGATTSAAKDTSKDKKSAANKPDDAGQSTGTDAVTQSASTSSWTTAASDVPGVGRARVPIPESEEEKNALHILERRGFDKLELKASFPSAFLGDSHVVATVIRDEHGFLRFREMMGLWIV